jgi:hypothetical protein
MMVTVIGLSALAVSRIQTWTVASTNDAREASALAFAAAEHALTLLDKSTINDKPRWRTTWTEGAETPPMTLGRGTISYILTDPEDHNLADDESEPVRLYGIGRVGEATRITSVELVPAGGEPLDVLRTTVHADGTFATHASHTITANGGPVSSNTLLANYGGINGDAESTVFGNMWGTLTGTQTITDAKLMPGESVFDALAAQATVIPWASTNHGDPQFPLLGAAVNPTGAGLNGGGIYRIHVPADEELNIRIRRIKATLVVSAGFRTQVRVEEPVLWEPHRMDLPILVVRGSDVAVTLGAPPTRISEESLGDNLNPPGMPYNGDEDALLDDTYPSELRGLIHVINESPATTTLRNKVRIRGTVIAHGDISTLDATVTHDEALYRNPPEGYTAAGRMTPVPGTWRRDQLPSIPVP